MPIQGSNLQAQLDEHDEKAMVFAQGQFRFTFGTAQGRFTLGFIGVKMCKMLGACSTDEERIRRNLFCEILEVMGLGGEVAQFEMLQKFMDHPVR